MKLTKEQQNATRALWHPGYSAVQVVAAAGSGKTSTLVSAIEYASEQIDANQIGVITFSRRAAAELKERIGRARPGFVGTMHALAASLLRRAGKQFSILDNREQVLKELCKQHFARYNEVPAELLAVGTILTANERQTLFEAYTSFKKTRQIYDFDDLIEQASSQGFAGRYACLFVDEFQDTSEHQVAFMKSLEPERLFVVISPSLTTQLSPLTFFLPSINPSNPITRRFFIKAHSFKYN